MEEESFNKKYSADQKNFDIMDMEMIFANFWPSNLLEYTKMQAKMAEEGAARAISVDRMMAPRVISKSNFIDGATNLRQAHRKFEGIKREEVIFGTGRSNRQK